MIERMMKAIGYSQWEDVVFLNYPMWSLIALSTGFFIAYSADQYFLWMTMYITVGSYAALITVLGLTLDFYMDYVFENSYRRKRQFLEKYQIPTIKNYGLFLCIVGVTITNLTLIFTISATLGTLFLLGVLVLAGGTYMATKHKEKIDGED